MLLDLIISTDIENLKDARACSYRDSTGWNIVVFLHRIHGNTGYLKIAEKIDNLFLIEYLCTIMRRNTKKLMPPCKKDVYSFNSDCICGFPLEKGMRLKIK